MAPEGTTRYFDAFGVNVELFSSSTISQWNEYLSIGGSMIGVRFARSDQTVATRYFHKDHLGSVAVITNENGVVVERNAYDAWGKRRFPNGTDDPSGSITSSTTRGYTNHEQLATVSLVHMNARVYDPKLAKFTSVDPVIKNLLNGQHHNGYSYVSNNPLKFTDPSGAEADGGEGGGEGGGSDSNSVANDANSNNIGVDNLGNPVGPDECAPASPPSPQSSPSPPANQDANGSPHGPSAPSPHSSPSPSVDRGG